MFLFTDVILGGIMFFVDIPFAIWKEFQRKESEEKIK